MKLEQWFSIPIIVDKIYFDNAFYKELNEYLLKCEKSKDEKNKILTQASKDGLFESQWDLFEREQPQLQELKKELYQKLTAVIQKLNGYDNTVTNSLNISEQSWFHITRNGGYFTSHNHPMASWSSVFCSLTDESDSNSESGVTRFFPPVMNNAYLDAGNAALQFPFNQSAMGLKLTQGDLIFFPSHLMHEVSRYLGNSERITIATNYWVDSELIKIRA